MSEGGEKQKPDEEVRAGEERMYPVKLRGALFGYFANRLAPIYKQELKELQQDGSFEKIKEFHESQFGKLMTRILDGFEDRPEIPEKVVLELSESDLKLILDRADSPQAGVSGMYIHREMKHDLENSFKSSRLSHVAVKLASDIFSTALGKRKKS